MQRAIRQNLWIYLVLIPPFVLLLLFTLIPIVRSFLLSFQEWTIRESTWIGMDNFVRLSSDAVFFKALTNTFLYTVAVVPLSTVIALALAELVRPLPSAMQTFFKSAFYLPAV